MNVDTMTPQPPLMPQWHFDASGYYAYVMVNGLDADVKNVEQALAQNRVKTILLGRSYRAADDGLQYDWYLRVATSGTGVKPLKTVIEQALGIAPPFAAQIQALEDAKAKIESLQHELTRTHQDLLNAQKQNASIRAQVEIAKSVEADLRRGNHGLKQLYEKTQDESTRLQEYAQSLELQIDILVDERDHLWEIRDREVTTITDQMNDERARESATATALKRQLDELRARHKILDNEYSALEREWLQAEDAIQEARSTIQNLANERDIAVAEKQCVEDQRDEIAAKTQNYEAQLSGASGAANEGELQCWLKVLLPNLSLTPASFSLIHNEIQDPVPVFRLLEQLNSQPDSVRGDNLQGKDKSGWVEKHFSTGESDLGRLYFYSTGHHEFRVHIGHKRTQRHDFGQLTDIKRKIEARRTREQSTDGVTPKA